MLFEGEYEARSRADQLQFWICPKAAFVNMLFDGTRARAVVSSMPGASRHLKPATSVIFRFCLYGLGLGSGRGFIVQPPL
jgi:hypothetical protein